MASLPNLTIEEEEKLHQMVETILVERVKEICGPDRTLVGIDYVAKLVMWKIVDWEE